MCYRAKNNIDDNYLDLYKCSNNTNNFNFIKTVIVNINNKKTYPIDIFNFYRQEYLPFIIHEEFIKFKNFQNKLNLFNKKTIIQLF